MPDIEKVTEGLECCLPAHDPDCDLCPYDSIDLRCRVKLRDDIIALLKAQEPVKPKRLRDWEREPPRCGNCGALIVIIGNQFTEHVYKAKFCCECGSPVKWE